jgi:hypothetical protein
MKCSLAVLALGLVALTSRGCVRPSQLFKRNAELKAEGYYMAEFEFKMMAALYYLNDGSYWKAYRTLRRVQQLPDAESWDDSHLVHILYPRETPIPDVMQLRQGLARYIGATGGEVGNWSSKESLKNAPLALKQAVKPVSATTGRFDLQAIARDSPETQRFFVVGVDRFQMPVFRGEYTRAEKL